MITALTLALLAATAGPDIRLYASQSDNQGGVNPGLANICLNNLDADPTLSAPGAPFEDADFHILTGDGVGDFACEAVDLAYSYGRQAYPAMRIYGSHPASVLVTKEHWDAQAALLLRLLDCSYDGRVGIDAEAYLSPEPSLDIGTLGTFGLTPETLKHRMTRFLRLVSGLNVRIYPVNVNDEAHKAIVDANPTTTVIFDESTFKAAERLNATPSTYGDYLLNSRRYHSALRRLWPFVRISSGLRDDMFRIWGYQIRERLDSDLGPEPAWFFDYWRGDSKGVNKDKFCSWPWVNGSLFNSRNDVENVWRVAVKRVPLAREPAFGSDLEKRLVTGGLQNDNVTVVDGWAVIENDSTYELVHGHGDGTSWAIEHTWRVDEVGSDANRIAWGSVKAGSGSGEFYDWWVEWQPDAHGLYDLVFAVRNGGPTVRYPIVAAQSVGTAFRHTVSIDDDEITLHHVDEHGVAVEVQADCLCSQDRIRIGTPTPATGQVSVTDDVIVWNRALTSEELGRVEPSDPGRPNVIGQPWPWGRW